MGILGFAALPLVNHYLTANRQVHGQARQMQILCLSHRVNEEVGLAHEESGDDERGLAAGPTSEASLEESLMIPHRVTDGESMLFDVIEDTSAPFGRMEKEYDFGITKNFRPLYELVESLRFSVVSRRRSLRTTGSVLESTVVSTVEITEGILKEESFRFDLPLWPVGYSVPSGFMDEEEKDRRILEAVYPGEEGALTAVVASMGANIDVIRGLGTVLAVKSALDQEELAFVNQMLSIENLIQNAPDDRTKAILMVEKARVVESRALGFLEAILYIYQEVKKLSNVNVPAGLGDPPPDTLFAGVGLLSARSLPAIFISFLMSLEGMYAELNNSPFGDALLPRPHYHVFQKFVEIHQLRLILVGPEDTSVLRKALDDFARFHEGRNQHLERWASLELFRSSTIGSLRSSDPSPARIEALSSLGVVLDEIIEILVEAAMPPD